MMLRIIPEGELLMFAKNVSPWSQEDPKTIKNVIAIWSRSRALIWVVFLLEIDRIRLLTRNDRVVGLADSLAQVLGIDFPQISHANLNAIHDVSKRITLWSKSINFAYGAQTHF